MGRRIVKIGLLTIGCAQPLKNREIHDFKCAVVSSTSENSETREIKCAVVSNPFENSNTCEFKCNLLSAKGVFVKAIYTLFLGTEKYKSETWEILLKIMIINSLLSICSRLQYSLYQ